MITPNPICTALAPAESFQLQRWLEEFDRSWNDHQLACWVRGKPAGLPDHLLSAALVGMVQVDLRRHWQRGHRVQVEAFLSLCPQLGTIATFPVALILEEYHLPAWRLGVVPRLV